MLIILGGLPGTGKTTIARALAKKIGAVHLRIDSIEEALISSGVGEEDLGPAGYMVAYELARDNLRIGLTVIADSVNPIELTRAAWRSVAIDSKCEFMEVEIVCSNGAAHQQRVEARTNAVRILTWQQVLDREYEPWRSVTKQIDTAEFSVDECISAVERILHRGSASAALLDESF